jgi:class 3 adenylate cyclase/tetratricopeptide (TPR) repeat protein
VTSVLFADLVGFTPLSEARDSEDVRELLSRYFDLARVVINRYGGTVEKFIGDAVMAVWGVPSAREDDAERAVRAGLDLLDAIGGLGEETGARDLAMRVGIVTGEVAVTLGAVGQGMVAGDAVNTAARIQSAARPGQVWVEDTTRGLTAAAVAYADEGEHQLKGKVESLRLFSAQRVIASVGGAQRVDGLEAPFVGRDREMRLVKELLHATLEEQRPRLVSVTGQPGVGKSRVGWEFFKHLDGITDVVRWHRGRCLAYGEGVAFWALAEMVRSRLDILEGDDPATVSSKLELGLNKWVGEPADRIWLSPRLGVLLGVSGGTDAFSQPELFAAWQLFFEALITPDAAGVVLLVEDLQWADDGLLDFLEMLLRRSNAPIFILTLARPEMQERRASWGTDRRATAIHLEPLSGAAMAQVIDGLVADLPDETRQSLVDLAEGIPLYALETVRALIDRDAVVPLGGRYVLAPEAALDLGKSAPTSLQTLIAARLDLLTEDERRTVQDAAVLGLTFPRASLVALRTHAGSDAAGVDSVLEALLVKEILALESDPRSPERGQYRFVQAMVRAVAYDTLSRRDRKQRHLCAAEQLLGEADSEAFASVISSHYVDAIAASPDDPDASELAKRAVGQLEIAAERARQLGSPAQAQRHFEQALDLAEGADIALRLLLGAAEAALTAGHSTVCLGLAERAVEQASTLGRTIDVGKASILVAGALNGLGRSGDVSTRLIPVYEQLTSEPSAIATRAILAKLIGRSLWITAESLTDAEVWFDRCVRLADSAELWDVLAECLSGYSGLMMSTDRTTMGLGLLRVALEVSLEHDLTYSQLQVRNNLAAFLSCRRPTDALDHVEKGLALAERLGEGQSRQWLAGTSAHIYWILGEWDRLDLSTASTEFGMRQFYLYYLDAVALFRGDLQPEDVEIDDDIDPQWRASIYGRAALSAWAAGDPAAAASQFVEAVTDIHRACAFDDDFPSFWSLMLEAAGDAGGHPGAERWLDAVVAAQPGQLPTMVRALIPYFRARLAHAADPVVVETDYQQAITRLRSFGTPLWLGLALMRYAEWLIAQGRGEDAMTGLDEAEQVFSSLRAEPLVEQSRQARAFAIR